MGRPLGQHFLFDPRLLERIAIAACPDTEPLVVEIGPGHGNLTEHLAARAEQLIAIELDPALAAGLRGRHTVVEDDVLRVDLKQWGQAVVAGNLPYYITSPIIDKVLGMGPLLTRAVFLVQKEVGERLAASPGTRDYGYLSVTTQSRCRVELLFTVKPGAFKPPPRVDSVVVRLTPQGSPPEGFLSFASRCFQHKRKTLSNNLPGIAGEPEARLRAEQLPVAQLLDLFQRFKSRS